MRAISGLTPPSAGEIWFDGRRIDGLATEKIVQLGIAHVPEGRRVFPDLTVAENLQTGAYLRRDKIQMARDLDEVFGHFPILAERRGQSGKTLSGGEQQMLAMGRALMSAPRLLLLDEPSLGLSPVMVQEIATIVIDINAKGVAVILVEQNAELALRLARYGYVLETGRVALEGPAVELHGARPCQEGLPWWLTRVGRLTRVVGCSPTSCGSASSRPAWRRSTRAASMTPARCGFPPWRMPSASPATIPGVRPRSTTSPPCGICAAARPRPSTSIAPRSTPGPPPSPGSRPWRSRPGRAPRCSTCGSKRSTGPTIIASRAASCASCSTKAARPCLANLAALCRSAGHGADAAVLEAEAAERAPRGVNPGLARWAVLAPPGPCDERKLAAAALLLAQPAGQPDETAP